MGTGGYFHRVNGPGRKFYHSPPFGAEAKNEWSCTPTTPVYLHGVDGNSYIFAFVTSMEFNDNILESLDLLKSCPLVLDVENLFWSDASASETASEGNSEFIVCGRKVSGLE